MLPPKPLEVSDFSGGITENILQGDPRRAEKLDNLLITADKKLIERPGFAIVPYNGYFLENTNNPFQRIDAFFALQNETYLLANKAEKFFVFGRDSNNQQLWTQILGVSGGKAFPLLESGNQVTYGEYQGQTYFAADVENGVKPIKIYLDDTNTWVAKTAGLPQAYTYGTETEPSLLTRCITLANDLRTQMIAHMSDAQYSTYTLANPFLTYAYLHVNRDKYSLSYFQTENFTGQPETPNPVPTPRPAATDQTTLFDLVEALNLAFTHHVDDSMKDAFGFSNSSSPYYHNNMETYLYGVSTNFEGMPRGPGAKVTNNSRPTDLKIAAKMLDDLRQKWYWHRLSVNTHSPTNDIFFMDRYAVTAPKIGTVYYTDETKVPTITPDWGDVYNFANNLKNIFNTHISSSNLFYSSHKQGDNTRYTYSLNITLPDATDLDSAYLLLYWVRAMYSQHTRDAQVPTSYLQISCTATAGSPNLTSVIRTDTGAAVTLALFDFVEFSNNTVIPVAGARDPFGAYRVARITTAGSGTATLDRNMVTSLAGTLGQATLSQYHRSSNGSVLGTQSQSTTSRELAGSAMGSPYYTLGESVATWVALGEDFFNAFSTHATNLATHYSGSGANRTYQSLLLNVPYPEFQIPEVASYSYAFFFSDTYTVGVNGVEYLTRGNPVVTGPIECAVSFPTGYVKENQSAFFPNPFAVETTRENVISDIATLTNDGTSNYDTANIKVQIYRTADNGNTYYLLDEIDNGTTTYTDTVNDTIPTPGEDELTTRQKIYTNGGVVGYDQPLPSKFIHTFNGTTYYGAVYDSGQFFPNRLLQSIAGVQDAAPTNFTLDLDDDLTGISSTKATLVALCKTSLFRISNQFNSLGQGGLEFERISDVVGCLNAKSIVQTEIGIFFAGTDGFYYTDGYQCIKISLEIDKIYSRLTASENQIKNIYGTYDGLERRIWWSMRQNEGDIDNNIVYVLHVNMGVKPSAAFTPQFNGLYFYPSSLSFFQGTLYQGTKDGFVLWAPDYQKYDIITEKNFTPSTWDRAYIPYWYRSIAIDLGTTFNRKYLTKAHIVGQNFGNVLAVPLALRDLNQYQAGAKEMAPINYLTNLRWGDPTIIWGDSDAPKWEYDGKLDLYRRFPRTVLRSDFMQFEIKPYDGIVYSSSVGFPDFTNATVDSTLDRVTLVTPSGYTDIEWPDDLVGLEISFSVDNYETSYPITGYVSDTVISVTDTGGTLINGSYEWQITGFRREQRLSMSSYVLHYAYLGDENEAYPGAKSNSGPGNAGGNP